MGQWRLLPQRRFGPLFATQFLGAFNDNFFKNALAIMIAYRAVSLGGLRSQELVALSAGVFILPFFLFSATAGQLTDKYPKSTVIRWSKAAEIVVMLAGAAGFFLDNVALLLVVLFFMGLQSTFFGPAKYSVLPELLDDATLVGGNALIEMGTFLAILFGTIAGGLAVAQDSGAATTLSVVVLGVAVLGFATSLALPRTPAAAPDLRVALNPMVPMADTYRAVRHNRPVYLSILGISWFWFFGASLLTLLPNYCKDVLRGDERVVTLCLALFSVGVALGSLSCERLSRRTLELGLVPLGSLGMTAFLFDLFIVGEPSWSATSPTLRGAAELLRTPGSWRVLTDLFMVSVFCGFFTVPLYTLVQQRSAAALRSRVIAGNNIVNALFMVVASALLMALLAAGLSIPQIFGVVAVLNLVVAAYIYTVVPEFLLRFVAWLLANILYRLRVTGRDNIPAAGPALLVCNHVTYVDWLLISAIAPRPVRFVMYHRYFNVPGLRWLLRDAKVIPIAPAHEDAGLLDAAFERIAAELAAGELVCIFPEGKLTATGELGPFRTGVERVLERTPVPVVPLALSNMWGSFFSRFAGRALRRPFRRLWSRVSLNVGAPLAPQHASASVLEQEVARLLQPAASPQFCK